MKYQVARAVGLNSDQRASLAISVPKDSENLFLAVLQLTSDDAFTRGRQLLSDLSDNFFEEDGSPPGRLTAIFQKAKQSLQDLNEYSLLLAAVSGKILYLISQSQVKVFLKRQDKFLSLLEEGNNQIISGFLEDGDRVFLSTAVLADFLKDDSKSLLELPLPQWEEEVNARLTGQTDDLAGLVLDIETEEEITVPAVDMTPEDVPATPKLNIKMPNLSFLAGRAKPIIGAVLLLIIILGVGLNIKNVREKDSRKARDFESKQGTPSSTPAYERAEFQEYLSLDLIKQGFTARNLSLSNKKILLLDPNAKTLVALNLDKKSNQIIAGKDKLGEAKLASLNGNLAFVFSEDKGVLRVDSENQKVAVVAKIDKEWGEIVDIYGFAGNVYLLDKAGQIWKYLPITDGYSDKRVYLNEGVKANFASAKKMQIESSVYVLKPGGEILRFTKGAGDFFSLGGLGQPLKEAKTFFASSEVDNLYILDADNARLLVISKVGLFQKEYRGDKFATASDLVVDEKDKKVYLLEGNKIYTMELR